MNTSLAIRLILAAFGLKLMAGQVRNYAAYRRERRRYPFRPPDRLWSQWEMGGLVAIGGFVAGVVALTSDWPEPVWWICWGIMMVGVALVAVTGNRIRHRKSGKESPRKP